MREVSHFSIFLSSNSAVVTGIARFLFSKPLALPPDFNRTGRVFLLNRPFRGFSIDASPSTITKLLEP